MYTKLFFTYHAAIYDWINFQNVHNHASKPWMGMLDLLFMLDMIFNKFVNYIIFSCMYLDTYR